MDDLDTSNAETVRTPCCPLCYTTFDYAHYKFTTDRACCPFCNSHYPVPDAFRPPHSEEALEYASTDPATSAALDQFRAVAKRVSEETIRNTTCGPYQMYARWFTWALHGKLEDLAPELRDPATAIARALGYIDDPKALAIIVGPRICSRTGLDKLYCHCGRHR